jgi:hypothetical protein
VTVTYPAVASATSEARIFARSSLAEMNVVERGLRFQFTTAPGTKFAPYTLSVNAPLPGTTACGIGSDHLRNWIARERGGHE